MKYRPPDLFFFSKTGYSSLLIMSRVQKKLVDSALLSHLLVDLQLEDHFTSLRRYVNGQYAYQIVVIIKIALSVSK